MDCHLLDLLLITASPKRHNEPESTRQPNKDKNNKKNNNDFKETITPPCDPGLMSQRRCNRLTTINSGRTTRKSKKTSSTVTSDPICTTALGTIESQSSTTVSSISERARTATTANRPVTTTASTTTVSTRSSTRSAILTAAKPVNFRASRRTSSRTNNRTNSEPCSVVVARKQDTAKHSKRKRGAVLTGNSSSGVRPSDSRNQDSYPRTKNICGSIAEKKVEIESKSTPRRERNSKAVVIAPSKESSDQVSTFDSSVSPSSVALAVAPITPRTQEGNYSASNSNKNRNAEITSVSSGTESQTASPPASEAASTTITTASTAASSTTAKDNKIGSSGSNVNKGSGSNPREGDPSRESFSKTQQKLVVPGGTDQGGDESGSLSCRPNSDKTSEILPLLLPNSNSEVEQKQQQQQQLPMNKSNEEGEAKEKRENKEVLESSTLPSPSPTSTISLPPTQEGELNQPAATDNTITTTTTTPTITTTDSVVASIYSGTDENSVSLKNKIVSHPGLDRVVPYCKSPSCTSSTTTTNASTLKAPSSLSTTTTTTPPQSSSSSSPSSLLVDCNEQPLKLSVTSAKHGSFCLKETPPAAKSTVQNSDATTTTATANSSKAIIVQESKTGSATDTMCGPSEDKIMPNSSGEPNGSATVEKNVDSTTSNTRSTPNLETTTATAKCPATLTITQTLSSLSHSFTTSTATAKAMATKLNSKSTSHVKNLMAPKVGPTLEKEEQATAAPSDDKNPSIVITSSQSLHASSPSLPPRSSSSSSTSLLPSSPSPAPNTSPPLVSMLTEGHKVVNCTSALQGTLSKGSCMVTDIKTLKRTSNTIKATPNEGSTAFGSDDNHNGSDDSASSQSPPNLGVDSPDSFVALPQTGFESSEFEEATEDSNSNNSGHVGVNSVFNLKVNKNSDCAFDDNVLERRCGNLISENTCDMEYDRVKSLPKVYYNDDSDGTSSKDFRFGSNVYRNIYGPFDSGYDCTFSVQGKDIDHLLETSSSKIGSTSSGFVSDLLRCTTAIADDHSYCSWSVSKTQDTESLLRDAHPCDDEISDSSSLDDIPDQQERLSFLAQNTFTKARNLRIQSPKTKTSSGGAEKNHKTNRTTSSTTPSNNNTFTLKPASKFLADLPSSGHDSNTQAYHTFDQKLEDDRKVNGLSTPVKFYDNNSGSITSPKITPSKSPGALGGRGSLQASPKVGCFRIGTFGSISNIDWDENSNTSSSVGSVTLSDKSREKFTYRRKVDFTDKTDKNLMSHGEQKSDGSGMGRHQTGDGNARSSSIASMVHILHDHDYCMRTTISPLKSELAKELMSGTKLGSCSSKYSNINSSKGSNSSSNSQTYSSSSSSSSPHSISYTGITPLSTPSSSTEVKCSRKSRNNSTTKFIDGSETLQESSLVEKTEEAGKLSDPNCDAARSNESKLKITGSFKNDYVYFLNKTTRSRRRISHEVLPDKNQARNYSDIVIPHLTDADIEALKRKRSQNNNLPVWKSSQDPSDLEADNRLMSSVLGIDNLCTDADGESVLPGLIDSTVVPDNLAANPEQYLTPEEMDILFNAVKEVENTNFNALDEIQKSIGSYGDESPASILHEDQMNPCLADVGDHNDLTDKSDVSTIASPQTAGIPVSQWSGCNSPVNNLTKSEVLTTESNLLDLENMPIDDINPMMGTGTDKYKGTPLSCTTGSGLPPSDLNTLCANNSNSSLTDENITSLDKFDLLNNSDLFPEPSVADTSNEGNAPWIVTVTMFWNDLPAIMMDNQPYIRLVDIHKQILPAKDTGILKKRCQLLGLEVQNCTEFQRYFLVQYGRAYNSKSTLVISKDDAKILIGYYVNPPTRIPKGEGCEDEPSSPAKRITKTNGSLVGRIKKHGRLIGSRKHSLHKIRNTESKDKINSEKLETGLEQQQQQQPLSQEEQQQQQHQAQQPTPAELTARPRQLKRKKERLALSASINGKARLRHKKINFLNLIRGETGTSSTTTPSSPAAATIASSASSSSETLSVVDLVNSVGVDPGDNATSVEKSMALLTSGKHSVAKCKTGLKNRIPTSQKVTGSREQDMGALENGKLKECNGRVGLPPVAHDLTAVRGGNQKKKQRNADPFSTVSSKHPSASKWKNSRNPQGIVGHPKSGHLKAKLKSKGVAASAATNGDANLITDKMQSLCPALLVYHEDAVPQGDQNLCMQPGKLYFSLYSAKNAKCIKCTTCAKVFSVDEFLQHQHLNPNTNSKLVVVSSEQSLRFRDGGNKDHQLLWKNFMVKRELFEFEGHEGSRLLSPLLRTAGVGAKGPVSSSSSAAPAALNSPATEHNGGNPKSSSTYRVSSRKRKQKQFYPIENYDFKNLPRSVGHGKDSTLDQFGQWGGKARGVNNQSNVGCSPSKKALTLPVSGTFPSYGVNVASSTRSHNSKSGRSLSENVVTLTNEPELLSFTALENDEYN